MTGAAELFMAARTQGNQVGVAIRTLDCEIARGGLPGSPSCCTIEKQQIVIADPINDAGKAAVENTDPNGLTDYGRGDCVVNLHYK